MKKIVSIISMSLLGIALYAGPVTPEKALQVASRVFASGPSTKAADASSLQIVWDGEFEPATKAAQDPAFYVVTRPEGGFVIVSGDDNMQPVLAFSFENEFKVEGMPSNVRWWMEELKGYARSAVRPTPEIEEAWEAFAETKAMIEDANVEAEYIGSRTNLWDQSGPANHYAPKIDVQPNKSVSGCVPLALAEIMAWFGDANKNPFYADPTVVTIASYTYNAYDPSTPGFTRSHTISAHNLAPAHSWASLKALVSNSAFKAAPVTEDGLGLDLGSLVYDIGTILQVQYNQNEGAGGTSGNLGQLNELATKMFYNKAATIKRRENYTAKEWIDMLVSEIHEHPVFYDGQDTGNKGGHAFVADGYATMKEGGNKVIHFNFGWGGTCNGYYNCLTDVQTTSPNYNFFNDNSALFGFVPDKTSSTVGILQLGFLCDGDNGGVTLSSVTNEKVNMTLSRVANTGSAPFTGNLCAFRVDKNGTRGVSPLSIMPISEPLLVGTYFNDFVWDESHLSSPALGDKYAFFYSLGSSDYQKFENPSSGNIVTELPYYPAAFIKKNAAYHPNDDFVFELTNHDYRYGNATWTVTSPDGVTNTYPQSDHKVTLTQTGWYTISVSTPGQETVTAYIQVTAL